MLAEGHPKLRDPQSILGSTRGSLVFFCASVVVAMKIKALESKARDQFKAGMRAKVTGEFKKLKVEVDLTEAAKALETATRDLTEAAREFKEVEGQIDEVQLKALAKVNEALGKIRHSKLGLFLERTKWFA